MLFPKNLKTCTFTLFVVIFIIFSQAYAKETHHIKKQNYSNNFLNAVQQWRYYFAEPQESHMKWSLGLIISAFFCFLAATISSAGGIGGGGLYLPILTIVAGLGLKTASSFSAFMVTGGSIANVVYYLYISCGTKAGSKQLIDYDVAILSQPCMLLGVSIGVICNVVFPEWLITALFAVFLAWTTTKTCRRGVFYWRQETDQAILKRLENGLRNDEASEQAHSLKEPILGLENDNNCSLGIPWLKLGILSLIWISFSVLYLLRGNKSGQSITQLRPCGLGYWILTSLQIPLAFIFTSWIILRERNHSPNPEDAGAAIPEDASSAILFPILAFSAGYLGGVFGIGGGMLISPLLLQTGMAPENAREESESDTSESEEEDIARPTAPPSDVPSSSTQPPPSVPTSLELKLDTLLALAQEQKVFQGFFMDHLKWSERTLTTIVTHLDLQSKVDSPPIHPSEPHPPAQSSKGKEKVVAASPSMSEDDIEEEFIVAPRQAPIEAEDGGDSEDLVDVDALIGRVTGATIAPTSLSAATPSTASPSTQSTTPSA